MATAAPSTRRAAGVTLLAAALAASSGCYDGDALVDRVRNDALKNRMEEVDLGRYSITMPRDTVTTETVEVEMHLYGSLARYRRAEVEERLEEQDYRLRHETLMVVRGSPLEDFTDPDLAALRERLLTATNDLLLEPSIQSVGFHEIRFTRR